MTHSRTRPRLLCLATLTAALLGAACSSGVVTVAPQLPEHYERLEKTSGEACGTLLFYSTVYSVVPVMLNSRVERAYRQALSHVPGATGLVNAEISESWVWWVIGTTFCTEIEGHAIRAVAAPTPVESSTP